MKYKLTWSEEDYNESKKSKEFQRDGFSLVEDIERLIDFGYKYFEIRVLESEEKGE